MIITVAFGKGGTGKTTTALALAAYARDKGQKVLCVDLDYQSNFTYALGGDPARPGMYNVLAGLSSCQDVLQEVNGFDLLPAGAMMASAETELAKVKSGRNNVLRDALVPVRDRYDLIVIDTHPDVNNVLTNALVASDSVLLTMKADSFTLMGLYPMADIIRAVQSKPNPDLEVAGILLTQYKPKQLLARDMKELIEEQAEAMGTEVFHTFIREGVAVQQAQGMRQTLFEYAGKSNPAQDYRQLFEEMEL